MAMKNVDEFFAAVKEDETLKDKIKAAPDPEAILKIAQEGNYCFSINELQNTLSKLPKKELASLVNPGVGTRLHLNPR